MATKKGPKAFRGYGTTSAPFRVRGFRVSDPQDSFSPVYALDCHELRLRLDSGRAWGFKTATTSIHLFIDLSIYEDKRYVRVVASRVAPWVRPGIQVLRALGDEDVSSLSNPIV